MSSKPSARGQLEWSKLAKSPLSELLLGCVIVLCQTLIVWKARIVSDALFLEGMTLSVAGALVSCKMPRRLSLKNRELEPSQPRSKPRHSSFAALLHRRTGLRVLLVGLILLAAAIFIGKFSGLP